MKNEDALFVQANGILKATRIGIAAAGNDCDTRKSRMATITYGTAHRDSWTLMLAKNAHRARYHQVNHTVISTGSDGLFGGNEIMPNQLPAVMDLSMPSDPSSRPMRGKGSTTKRCVGDKLVRLPVCQGNPADRLTGYQDVSPLM